MLVHITVYYSLQDLLVHVDYMNCFRTELQAHLKFEALHVQIFNQRNKEMLL